MKDFLRPKVFFKTLFSFLPVFLFLLVLLSSFLLLWGRLKEREARDNAEEPFMYLRIPQQYLIEYTVFFYALFFSALDSIVD